MLERPSRRGVIGGLAASILAPHVARATQRLDIPRVPLIGRRRGARLPVDGPSGYPAFPSTRLATLRTVAGITKVGSGTLTDAAMADSPYGSTALQFVVSTTAGSLRSGAVLSTPVDVRNGNIRWTWKPINNWITNTTVSMVGASCNLRLYSSGSPASPPANFHSLGWTNNKLTSSSPAVATPGHWQYWSQPSSRYAVNGLGANLAAITWASVDFRATSATDVTFGVGDIDFISNPRSRGALMFRCDDGWQSAYTNVFPALKAIGKGGILCIGTVSTIVDSVGPPARITTAMIQEMLNSGWQFGSQSYSTESNTIIDGMDSATRDQEFKNNRAFARDRFDRYGDSADGTYFSNVGISDVTAYPELAANFRTLWRFQNGQGATPSLPDGETFPFADPKNICALNAQTWSDGTTVAKITDAIAQAIANNGVLMLAYHDLPNSGEGWDGFQYALSQAANIDITTPRDLLAPYLATYGSV